MLEHGAKLDWSLSRDQVFGDRELRRSSENVSAVQAKEWWLLTGRQPLLSNVGW